MIQERIRSPFVNRRGYTHRAALKCCLAAVMLALASCGSDNPEPAETGAISSGTSTPSVTSSAATADSSPDSSAATGVTSSRSGASVRSTPSGSGVSQGETSGSTSAGPHTLPLLPAGRHLGVTLFGSGDASETPGVHEELESAAGEGLSVFTSYVDWFDLETSPGNVDVSGLTGQLAWQQEAGLLPLVNLLTIDISNLNLPPDLLAPDGRTLAPGRSFDDEDIVNRFLAVLDALVPALVEHGGFLLLLGNEVDEHFSEFPDADFEAFANLLAQARAHVHRLNPELAVGVTVTSHALRAGGPLIESLQAATDLLVLNYYPLETTWGDDWFTILDADDIPAELEALIALYDGRPIVFQELGCPSGEGSDSSEVLQDACFRTMLETIEEHDNIRLVNVFTLHDFDEPTCDFIVEIFGLRPEDLPGRAFERWRSYLCTLGVLRPEGSPKPAWATLLEFARGWRSD